MKDIPFDMFTDRSAALVFHLTVNFYPRLPEGQVNGFVGAFKNYWAGNTDLGIGPICAAKYGLM